LIPASNPPLGVRLCGPNYQDNTVSCNPWVSAGFSLPADSCEVCGGLELKKDCGGVCFGQYEIYLLLAFDVKSELLATHWIKTAFAACLLREIVIMFVLELGSEYYDPSIFGRS
jgi:hypothetical protein